MKAFVYILQDDTGKFYVGSTDNLTRRFAHHKAGHTQTTSNMINPRLVLSQDYGSLLIARQVERKIKLMKRKDYLKMMVRDGHIKLSL